MFLVSLLIAFISLLSIPPMSGKLVAQITSVSQCGGIQPTDWVFQSLQSLIERYGVDGANACSQGKFAVNHPEVRADIADWFVQSINRVSELIASSTADLMTKEDLAALEQFYNQLLAEVEALERVSQQP